MGEQVAAFFLSGRGYRVVAKNQRTPVGELDLICRKRSQVVIVEVKARSGGEYGTALEAIGPRKARRLRAGRRPMEIARFYARKPWIGKGAGARLMQICLREAEQQGCDVIWLDVWERNYRAIGFYRKWGFVEVGIQGFQLGDDLQRDLLMARVVTCGGPV